MSSTVAALALPLSLLLSSAELEVSPTAATELEYPPSLERSVALTLAPLPPELAIPELPPPEAVGSVASPDGVPTPLFVLAVSVGPENSCDEPQLGSTAGGVCNKGAFDDVVSGMVNVASVSDDWSGAVGRGRLVAFWPVESEPKVWGWIAGFGIPEGVLLDASVVGLVNVCVCV